MKTTPLRASQARVLAMFKMYGDLTDEQLTTYLREMEKSAGMPKLMSPSGVRSRRCELVRRGLVRATDAAATTEAGRKATVWGIAR